MAVIPTGAIYKTLNFDGQSSGTYGVYITGDAVFNAPERDVEMVEIPGRNGTFVLDNGRFENIEVTYPAGIFAETEADFAAAISDFRNYLCSRKGYCRLTDDYNPDEYRLGIYKSGLEVDPAFLKAGQFNITFECKPQRFLNVGETEQTIAQSGDTLTNPTLFESSPFLAVKGYGKIQFNGYEVEIDNVVMGDVTIFESRSRRLNGGRTYSYYIPEGLLNVGDSFTLNGLSHTMTIGHNTAEPLVTNRIAVSASSSGLAGVVVSSSYKLNDSYNFDQITNAKYPLISLVYGTPFDNTVTIEYDDTIYVYDDDGDEVGPIAGGPWHYSLQITYDGQNTITYSPSSNISFVSPEVRGNSTVSILGNPTYIDCDIGEAYMIKSGEIISLNAYIDLGSKLPALVPGSNAITYDNTITELKIAPRWWKV